MEVDAALEQLANGLMGRMGEIVDTYVARARVEVPEFFASEEPAVSEATRESARANYVFVFEALRAGRDVPGTTLAAAAEETRVAAEMGVSLNGLLRTYYVGHSTAWEFILDEIERIGLDPPTRTAVLQLTSRYAFRYVERISALVTDEYGRARQAQLRSRDRRRARLVRDLLDGLPGNAEGLGYPLSRWHLAAIAWGEQPEAAIGELAKTLEGSPLTVAGQLDTLWGWIGVKAPEVKARLEQFELPPSTQLAAGVPGHGRAGFRRSHEQAQKARSVALRSREPFTWWRKVALEALMLHDEEAARAFVREELGALAGKDPRATVLRQTLAAWFEAQHRSAGAAALLGVHERTVTYRLHTIDERLGHAILERRTELETALRLHDHCGLCPKSVEL